jgi:hypothetical protein
VVVRDTISTNLDLSTFRFIGSKHPVSYTVDPVSREVVFRFSGIQLLPSVDSLEGSQGYFTYEIKELANLNLNSEIKNTAYIFFDFNPAIITNTTLNINGYAGNPSFQNESIMLFPNPFKGTFQISGIEKGSLFLHSTTGQLILSKEYTNGDLIDVSGLENGFYLVRLTHSKGEFMQKLQLIR